MGGGKSEVLPLQKRGAEQVLAMLKGGHTKIWDSFNTGAWISSDTEGGGYKTWYKRGKHAKSFTLS